MSDFYQRLLADQALAWSVFGTVCVGLLWLLAAICEGWSRLDEWREMRDDARIDVDYKHLQARRDWADRVEGKR